MIEMDELTYALLNAALLAGFVMYAIVCRMYTGLFVKKRKFKEKWHEYALIAANGIFLYVNLMVLAEYITVKLIMMFLICLGFMWLTYEHQLIKIFFCVMMHFTLVVVIDYIWPVLLSIFIPAITGDVVYYTIAGPIMAISAHFFHLGIIFFIKKFIIQKYSTGLSRVEWIYFSVLPLVTIVIFMMTNMVFGFVENHIQKKIVSVIAIGLLAMNVAMFCLIRNILKREAQIRESNLFLERVKNETEMYRNISKNYAMQRKREHEFKNQMAFITSLARDERIDELNNYLKEYNKNSIVKMNAIDTNNVIVNAIINSKYQEAREKNIVLTVRVNDLSGIKLKDEDIVLILSNLLNNAMEACEKCENGVIRLKFVKEESAVLISVENTIAAQPVVKDNTYITTKTEHIESHGMGIGNIRDTVEAYGGQCVIRYNEKIFHFTIYIPQ